MKSNGSEINGQTLSEALLKSNRDRAQSILVNNQLHGTFEELSDGRTKLSFQTFGMHGKNTNSKAQMTSDGRLLIGESKVALASATGKPSELVYRWRARRLAEVL